MKNFNRNLFLVLCILSIQLGLYLFLSHRTVQITPPGHVHGLLDLDLYYPDFIRQGARGAWSIFDAHTTVPTPNIYTYIFFVIAGKIAALGNIDPVVMYEITRITGGIALFFATYWLITLLLPKSFHLWAIIFTMAIDTSPQWSNMLVASMPSQTLIARHFGFPHHLWGETLGLILICLVIQAIKKPTAILLLFICSVGIFGTSTSPPYFVILMLCLFIPWLFYGIATKTFKKIGIPVLAAIISIIVAGLWIKFEFAKGPPWNAFTDVERSWFTTNSILIPFIQSFSLYYPFVLILALTLPFTWKKLSDSTRQTLFLTASWTMIPVPLIFLSHYSWFPIINGRIASDLSPVPIGILATISIYTFQKSAQTLRLPKGLMTSLLVVIMTLSLFLSLTYIKNTMRVQDFRASPAGQQEYPGWFTYPTKSLWEGMMSLKGIPPYSNVMVLPLVGEYLPALLPVRTYMATHHSFNNWWDRRDLAIRFYSGGMSETEVRKFLSDNVISYVFYGHEELTTTTSLTFYPDILETFFQNQEVTIFKVRQ
jgi:hypothetical protein